jgi:DNA replication protein DnaC
MRDFPLNKHTPEDGHLPEEERPPIMLPPVSSLPSEDVCPICKGAGFLRTNVAVGHPLFGTARPCGCTLRARTTHGVPEALLPAFGASWTFASYLTLPLAETQRQILARVQAFVLLRLRGHSQGHKRGLWLHGLRGTGKTGLAIAALQEVLAAGEPGVYLHTTRLVQILRDAMAASQRIAHGYAEGADREEELAGAALRRLVQTTSWLVLDDLDVVEVSRWMILQLCTLLENRRAAKLVTICTSSFDAYSLQHHWQQSGDPRAVHNAVWLIHRLGEYCVPLELSGRDLRGEGP